MGRLTKCGKWTGIALVIVGLSMAIIGGVALGNFSSLFRFILGKKVALTPTSQGFPIWKDVSSHLTTKFAWNFFNLTNAAEVVKGATPIVEEIGPFWYKAVLTKTNIKFLENQTVSFEEHRHFEFMPEDSIADDETTVIHLLNVPFLAALHKIKDIGYFGRWSAGSIIEGFSEGIVINMTVRELTYQGRPNTLVALSNAKEGIMKAVQALSGGQTGQFGFGVDRNNTEPGIFNMYQGTTGVYDLNRIYSTNYKHVLDIWPDHHNNTCNVVDGTFGYLRPPMRETNNQKVYVPDMCRSVDMVYEKDVEFHGLRLRRFTFADYVFANRDEHPENSCFDEVFRLPSGVAEVGPCKKGVPIVISQPHFLNADPSYRENVKGLSPDKEKHEFFMDHEPTTGSSVRVRGRLQANFRVMPTDIGGTDDLPAVVLPLFWQEMFVEAGPGMIGFIKTVLGYPGLAKIALVIVLLLGIVISILGVGCIINHERKVTSKVTVNSKSVHYTKAETEPNSTIKTPEQDALV